MDGHEIHAVYWHQQLPDKPLFPDALWSRPERRNTAGKLLIIGGNGYGFADPAEAYSQAQKAGIGEARVVLPDALKPTIGKTFAAGQFVPSTPSGSFSQKALADMVDASNWAEGVMLAGDLGRNSETTMLLEKFMTIYSGQLVITKDAADYAVNTPAAILERPDTTLVIQLGQLQKLAMSLKFPKPFTFKMDLLQLIEVLHEFSSAYKVNIVVKHLGYIFVAIKGEISNTKSIGDDDNWQIKAASYAAVWWLQNKQTPFAALSSAIYTMERA
jgi:hypothetical protein